MNQAGTHALTLLTLCLLGAVHVPCDVAVHGAEPRVANRVKENAGKIATDRRAVRDMLVINEDNSHFFGTRKAEDMTLDGLRAFVDQYAGSRITHLFLCPNAMRASFRSKTRDAIWDPVDGKSPTDRWPVNAKRLHDAGLDPYTVWIDRCREKGISPWISMRMNDIHSVDDPSNFMHSTFWRAHPEYWRVPRGSASPWVNRALNYAHTPVREYQMRFVRELLERYDMDGLELDWMRFGYHLTPGHETQEAHILTQFVRDVRALTRDWSRRRGHSIVLGVRVPAHPDAAAGLGMNAVEWAEQGLVDLIVPCPFWTSSDFDIPVELWKARLGVHAARVTVAPGLEYNARPWPGAAAVANDLRAARGFAASARYRGADSIYLFNWMDSQTRPVQESAYRLLLHDGLSEKVVAAAPRRHPVCFRDTVPSGFPNGAQLPAATRGGAKFQVHIGPRPTSGKVWAIVGLARQDGVRTAEFRATLNGRPLAASEEVKDLSPFGGGPVRAIRFACPRQAASAGYNKLDVQQVDHRADQKIVWVEIDVEP